MTLPGDFSAGKQLPDTSTISVTENHGRTVPHTSCPPGHVGPPLPCNLVKLVDVPDMNYLAANGEGEVRTR